jgi:hypothetical protein
MHEYFVCDWLGGNVSLLEIFCIYAQVKFGDRSKGLDDRKLNRDADKINNRHGDFVLAFFGFLILSSK